MTRNEFKNVHTRQQKALSMRWFTSFDWILVSGPHGGVQFGVSEGIRQNHGEIRPCSCMIYSKPNKSERVVWPFQRSVP